MNKLQIKILELLDYIADHYTPFMEREDEKTLLLIDPIEKKYIGIHYGETHLSAAFIIGGMLYNNQNVIEKGIDLLNGFFRHVNEYEKLTSYHWDFNNFALCVLYEYFNKNSVYIDLQVKIKNFILKQKDSNNATINWLPMRYYVNKWKYEWTKNYTYLEIMNKLIKRIKQAQYKDGYFEDLLPKGTSFNFQYHIYTTAVLAFLKIRGNDIADLDNAIARSEDIMDYQGDINYLGRGNNQIFAWGPAIYLFHLLQDETSLEKALQYVYEKSLTAIKNDNLILNSFDGRDQNWWWDYHYSSVYIAHYLFWMILTAEESAKISYVKKKNNILIDSGVHIHKGKKYNVVVFDGRKHYLAEKGKVIANITSKNGRSYFKGPFGPYYKDYGFKYSSPDNTIHNFIGIIQQNSKLEAFGQKIIFPKDIKVKELKDKLHIEILFKCTYKNVIINIPWFFKKKLPAVRDDTGNVIDLKCVEIYKGPYGWVYLFQSKQISVNRLILEIID